MMRTALVLCSVCLTVLAACAPPPPPVEDPYLPPPDPSSAQAGQDDPSSISEGNLAQGGGAGGGAEGSLEALREGTPPATGALKDVYFDFDRSDLGADARGVLQSNSDWIRENPGISVEIEGHADNRGTTEYNLALGARRAQAVKDYLVTLGNAPGRLTTVSYGEELPVCGASSEECWRKNRRAHFVVRGQRPAS